MTRIWIIDVVHHMESVWKRPEGKLGLIKSGVPAGVAVRWERVHREMHQELKRKIKENVN